MFDVLIRRNHIPRRKSKSTLGPLLWDPLFKNLTFQLMIMSINFRVDVRHRQDGLVQMVSAEYTQA